MNPLTTFVWKQKSYALWTTLGALGALREGKRVTQTKFLLDSPEAYRRRVLAKQPKAREG